MRRFAWLLLLSLGTFVVDSPDELWAQSAPKKAKRSRKTPSSRSSKRKTAAPAPESSTEPAAPSEPEGTPATVTPTVALPAPTLAPPTVPAPPESVGEEEELVDFEAEERASAERDKRALGGGDQGVGLLGGAIGLKFFVDLLVDYTAGEKKFEFRPNHAYVFVQVSVYDDVQFIIHVSDNPIFFELSWNITPKLTLAAGKLLVPFGTNQFHHIIGGRVDELSYFLPETWGDYGLSFKHQVYEADDFEFEYLVYVVNGFGGTDGPVIAAGSLSDNNFWKAIGTQLTFTFLSRIRLITSTYLDAWDVDNEHKVLFYAIGAELNPGLIPLPVLRNMRLRGEWARGEIQLPDRNYQQGILEYAYARSGYFLELTYLPIRTLGVRFRAGRINPDNTVTDDGDIEVYEPAVLFGIGEKIIFTAAWQLTAKPGFNYSFTDPPDIFYAKMFLQY